MSQKSKRDNLIRLIHESDLQLAMAVTGGGSRLIGELLAVPGASNTVLDANIPYSEKALVEFLRRSPNSFCSAETSKWMAVNCYFDSLRIHKDNITAFACTAALATDRAKKGEHRFFKSIQTRNKTRLIQVTLEKGLRSRIEEEEIIVELGLNELAKMIGVVYDPVGLSKNDVFVEKEQQVNEEWAEVFHSQKKYCHVNQDSLTPPQNIGILPGSFNPLHAGHLEMAAKFEKLFGVNVHFELAIQNADKPPLDFVSIHERINQFENQDVWLTNTSTFVEKSEVFPGSVFIVGADTIIRIADPKYYHGRKGLDKAIDLFSERQCRFAVFGRWMESGFKGLADLSLPNQLTRLCEEIPESEYRNDISSTQLRSSQS